MKTLAYPLLFLILVSFTNDSTVTSHKTIFISPKSELEIVGSTNVSTFTCSFNVQNLNKPLRIGYWEGKDLIRFQKSTLVLDNSFFDCGGKGINKDFHILLRTRAYPQILLTLKEIKKKAIAGNKVEALIEIQIAGVNRSYVVEVDAKQEDDLHLNGQLKLNITDFNLEAPKKILGLIVVSEEIEILFKLIVVEEKS